MPGSHNNTSDLVDYRVPRKLQDFYFYYGRWYGKSGNLPREKYIFPIDKEELARLDILHKFFLVVRKNHLFSASLDVEQPLRILDLGTGTGIWAIELSEKYPHMHVQGLDFNMIQPKMIPRTMAPPKPFDLEGSWATVDLDWDFMHVRTLFGSIQNWPDLYKKMIIHLKPGWGCMEQVEIDWIPQCDDDSLPTDSALSEWASKLLDAMDQYGRPIRVNPEKTRRQLALAGFVNISETVIRACYNPWPEDATEKEAARWFNVGLSSGLTALSCAAMVRMLGMSKEEVEGLCDRVNKEICMRSYHAYCRIYIWTARKPGTASRSSSVLSS
ncbi:Secondary metabolism regulator laeA [Fusarium oxysporum f. sp. rapae]|uniref:Secondary metabolism regulator laeA n=1 Tax=Fusarium oxysporum f. sp. rapae TaxID=485398 RepID=A0A8J5NQ43_FUSOX|nr:Secondary metabolism regulator laeA [Fusarium oxysporum f. sp. rapae]